MCNCEYSTMNPVDYDFLYSEYKPVIARENRYLARTLSRMAGATLKVVDVGSGTGLLLRLLPLPPARYCGIDINPKMTEYCRIHFPGYYFINNAFERVEITGSKPYMLTALFSASEMQLVRLRMAYMRARRALLLFYGPGREKAGRGPSRACTCPTYTREQLQALFPGRVRYLWGRKYVEVSK